MIHRKHSVQGQCILAWTVLDIDEMRKLEVRKINNQQM